jgi:phage tail-like protein
MPLNSFYPGGQILASGGERLEFFAAPSAYDMVDLQISTGPYTDLVLVASSLGVPATILDGTEVATFANVETVYTHTEFNVPPGFRYYTAFKQDTLPSDVLSQYVPVLNGYCFVPTDHGSTDLLMERIPMYYRAADDLGSDQLRKFLSVIGWEIDFIRSLTDLVATSRDPSTTHAQALRLLIETLGLPVDPTGISDSRLRWLAKSATRIRQGKGTTDSIEQMIQAITGWDADVTRTGVDRAKVEVYSQRTNFVSNPKFAGLSYPNQVGWTVTGVVGGVTWAGGTIANTSGSTQVIDMWSTEVPSKAGFSYGTAVKFLLTFAGSTVAVGVRRDGTFVPTTTSGSTIVMGSGATQRFVGRPVSVTADGVIAMQVRVTLPHNTSIQMTECLMELGPPGVYFDGSTDRSAVYPSLQVFDYRWDGTASRSISHFNHDLGASQQTVVANLSSVLPVGVRIRPNQQNNTFTGPNSVSIGTWSLYPGRNNAASLLSTFPFWLDTGGAGLSVTILPNLGTTGSALDGTLLPNPAGSGPVGLEVENDFSSNYTYLAVSGSSISCTAPASATTFSLLNADGTTDTGAVTGGAAFSRTSGSPLYISLLNASSVEVARYITPLAGSATGYTDPYGVVWTISRPTSGRKAAIVSPERPTLVLGTDDYIEVANHADLNFTGSESFTFGVVYRQWATPVSGGVYMAKRTGVAGTTGWGLTSNGVLHEATATIAGTGIVTATGPASTAGELRLAGAIRNVGTDQLIPFLNGTLGTPVTDTSTTTLTNSEVLRIGRYSGAGATYQDFEFIAAFVARRVLTQAELATIAAYYRC